MSAICKLKYSPDFEAYNFHLKPFNYYIIHLVYSENNNEVLKTYTYYEDPQLEGLINGNQNILFYKYLDVTKNKTLHYISIKIDQRIYNFKINNLNKWMYNYEI